MKQSSTVLSEVFHNEKNKKKNAEQHNIVNDPTLDLLIPEKIRKILVTLKESTTLDFTTFDSENLSIKDITLICEKNPQCTQINLSKWNGMNEIIMRTLGILMKYCLKIHYY